MVNVFDWSVLCRKINKWAKVFSVSCTEFFFSQSDVNMSKEYA